MLFTKEEEGICCLSFMRPLRNKEKKKKKIQLRVMIVMASETKGVLPAAMPGKCACLSPMGAISAQNSFPTAAINQFGRPQVEGLYLGMPNHNNKNKAVEGTGWLRLASSGLFPGPGSPAVCWQNSEQNLEALR